MKHTDQIIREIMHNAFKPTPERFRYTVAESIREAEQSAPVKHRFSKGTRIALAVVLIAVLLPTTVFGASKLIGLFAEPVDRYGLAINVETVNTDYPEYVKMHVNVPEGFIVEPNTDDLKYSEINSDGSFGEGAFSLYPMRPTDSSTAEVVGNVGSYEELTLCGHTAYNIRQLDNGSYNRLYVSYGDVNILLLIYYSNVTENQLEAFVSGISFAEGTVDDHTELLELFDERIENKGMYTYQYTNIEYPSDTVMTFRNLSEKNADDSIRYTAQITGVRVTDNMSSLENARVKRYTATDTVTGRNSLYDTEQLTDDDGKLLPRTVTVTKGGDRFTTTDEIISTEEMEQSLILIDVTYTNLSDEDTFVYIPYNLEVYNKNDDGSFTPATDVNPDQRIFSSPYCDREMLYNSDPLDTVKCFYITPLSANEAKTITIGYRCCTEKLDKAYITIVDVTSAGIVSPYDDAYNSMDKYPNYIMKVQ